MIAGLELLYKTLSKLPSLGPRAARKILLRLVKNPQQNMVPLAHMLLEAAQKIQTCPQCYNIDTVSPCPICLDSARDPKIICVVEDISSLWSLEKIQIFQGRYHVLGGLLSAMDGMGPEQLQINSLVQRVQATQVQELILALSPTMAGQNTAHYIREKLSSYPVKVSTLAQGLPLGAELEGMDEGTLHLAFLARNLL